MVILADTSVWVSFLRNAGTPAHHRLAALIRDGAELAVTEPVIMEVLAGARSPRHLHDLRRMLGELELLRVDPFDGYEEAAAVFRTCRRAGTTPRSLVDCLIAATAIRAGAVVLHDDRDFDVIARHTPLQVLDT